MSAKENAKLDDVGDDQYIDRNWFRRKWIPASAGAMETAEAKILSYLKTPYIGTKVNIGHHVGNEENFIWTIILNKQSPNMPLVIIHGFACGIPIWVLNLDSLAKNRPVYAIDMLGFGRSSRPTFSKDDKEAEDQLLESIEEWRRRMNLEKFILVGHSMGGFISSSYSLRYPRRVQHLILVDPWGFEERQSSQKRMKWGTLVKVFAPIVQPIVNPFDFLRVAGPFGPMIIDRIKPWIKRKFGVLPEDAQNALVTYIYNNIASKPSAEAAYNTMTENYGWAKSPMSLRFGNLSPSLRASFVCGSKSWLGYHPLKKLHETTPSQFDFHVINDGTHELFADQAPAFNSLMEKIIDSNGPPLVICNG